MSGLIVHEWIEKHGGAEKVLDAMASAFPGSDISCLWNDTSDRYPNRRIIESWLAATPLRGRKALSLPLMPSTWRQVDIANYDWVLISSHLFAHHVGTKQMREEIPVFVYAHTPARYIWASDLDKRGRHPLLKMSAGILKRIDKAAANEGTVIAANSEFVKKRIHDCWGQDSTVIYPPIAVEKLQSHQDWSELLTDRERRILDSLPKDFILGASRFVEYKQLGRVIEVGEACGLPVVLAGSGPERSKLQVLGLQASVPVTIIDSPRDELLYALYQKSMLFVFPPVEDFGIMPVEAMALGTPVLVNPHGGAAESVSLLGGGAVLPLDGCHGLADAVAKALSSDMRLAAERSARLSEASFMRNLKRWMGHDADSATTALTESVLTLNGA